MSLRISQFLNPEFLCISNVILMQILLFLTNFSIHQITLFDSADLAGAIAYSRLLKLTLFVNGQMVKGRNVANVDISPNVKQELREIRDRINHLLDVIEDQVDLQTSLFFRLKILIKQTTKILHRYF